MNAQPLVSIIVSVYNGAKGISQTLDSLCKQTYNNIEIIVVDDGSTDNTVEIVEVVRVKDHRIRLVHHERNLRLAAGRNTGLHHSRGEIICFTDDDVVVDPHWIEALMSVYRKRPEVAGVGGRIASFQVKTLFEKYATYGKNKVYDHTPVVGFSGRSSLYLKKFFSWRQFQLQDGDPIQSIMGMNSSYRRSVLEITRGFDPSLMKGEDWDANIRALKSKTESYFDPQLSRGVDWELNIRLQKNQRPFFVYCRDAIIYHKHRQGFWDFVRHIYSYGRAYTDVAQRHPEIILLPYPAPVIFLLGVFLAFFHPFFLLIPLLLYTKDIPYIFFQFRKRHDIVFFFFPFIDLIRESTYNLGIFARLFQQTSQKSHTSRIAIIIETWFPYVGGGQVYIRALTRGLVETFDRRIDIITRSLRHNGKVWNQNEEYYGGKLRVVRLGPALPFANPFGRLYFMLRLFLFLLRHEYVILNPQSILPGLPAKLAGLVRQTPVVYTIHGTALFLQKPRALRRRFERWVEYYFLTRLRYDAEITVARNFFKLPNRNRNIIHIPNGIDVRVFDAEDATKNGLFTFLYVGRFDPIKGVADLIQAARILDQRDHVKFQVLLVGEGSQKAYLHYLMQELHLASIVKFLGRKDDEELIRTFKSSHVFVLPSHSEGFPLTLLEAWACKLPVIVTRVGDNAQLIQHGKNGFLVAPRNPSELATTMKRAYYQKHLSQLGEQGYFFVKQNYLFSQMLEKTNTIFEKLCNS